MKIRKINLGLAVLSSLILFPRASFAHSISVYWTPQIQGLPVGRCINSNQYPDGCSESATEHAADEFCEYHGHSYASFWDWEDQSTNTKKPIYKLLEEGNRSNFRSHFRVVQGSYIFTGIVCNH